MPMLFNITLSIFALIALNVVIFLVVKFLPKNVKVVKEELINSIEPIQLNSTLEVETTSQELAPTGS